MSRSLLILSQGPVPTPEHHKVEGGGLRCWGLAKGVHANDDSVSVTVAYHDSYVQDEFTGQFEGIHITTWNPANLPDLLDKYDSVIVSYSMSELAVRVVDHLRPDQQLVLDCYVPIYVEVSARDSDDTEREYYAFQTDVRRWEHILKRGDVFLCSSEAQKEYYKGVLSAVGRINPVTYNEDMILVAPYGIYRDEPKATHKPISKLIDGQDRKKILWFGGIYPWFDLRNLVDAIKLVNNKLPAELIIVGAKNPFNDHPDFVSKYDELLDYIKTSGAEELVKLQDWVKFEDRANWYLDSDIVVVINKEGQENELSWRTRLVDFMWADLPVITNGGDPLGEAMLAHNAAIKMHDLSAKAIADDLVDALKDKAQFEKVRKNLNDLKADYYWDVTTKDLTKNIVANHRAADLSKYGYYSIGAAQPAGRTSKIIKVKNMTNKARMIPAYARKHGTVNTYYAMRTKVKNRLGHHLGLTRKEPGVVMIAHQLDFSGAPYVFMDLAEEVIKHVSPKLVDFHTFNPALRENISRLNKLGIKPRIHITRDIPIQYVKGDTVVLNTVAHSSALKHHLYSGLEQGNLKRLVWFIHEDDPELLFSTSEINTLRKLLQKDKVIMFIAAKKTLENYQEVFGNTDNIRLQPYKYVIPERFQKVRPAADFDKLSFILPGTMGDGRKGQLPVFYALADFYKNNYQKNPKQYRDFELVYVGISDDFLSRQVLNHAAMLGDRFKHHGRVTHEKSSELMMQSNMTVCYSLRECLPLFVFEGMAAGHPLLRNDSSGIDEQLFAGKNGYLLDTKDYYQMVDTFEKVLNKKTTTNQELAKMSAYSNKVAVEQADHSYEPMVKAIIAP